MVQQYCQYINYTRVGKPSKIVDDDGNLGYDKNAMWAVADWSKHCVYIFDGQDQLIREVGSPGSHSRQLNKPEGVAYI